MPPISGMQYAPLVVGIQVVYESHDNGHGNTDRCHHGDDVYDGLYGKHDVVGHTLHCVYDIKDCSKYNTTYR